MDLVGKCLVARPNIIDPFFKRSVVFIYEHSKGGTMGFVINKRKPDIMLRDLLNDRGFDTAQNDPVYNGGPVNPRAVCMVHSTGWQSSNTMIINDQISVTSDDLMIYKFVNGDIRDEKCLKRIFFSFVFNFSCIKSDINPCMFIFRCYFRKVCIHASNII